MAQMVEGYRYFKIGASWGGYESRSSPPIRRRSGPRCPGPSPDLSCAIMWGWKMLEDLLTDLDEGFQRLQRALAGLPAVEAEREAPRPAAAPRALCASPPCGQRPGMCRVRRPREGQRNDRLIDEESSRVAGKPAAKVRERHGHGVGDDRLPGGPVRPAAHRPPGHHPCPGLIDKERPWSVPA